MTDPSPTTPLMDEEAWYALLLQARRFRDAGHEEAFVDLARTAFRFRPHRAEPLHDLARHYLATSRGDLALLYADAGLSLELPQHDSVGLEPDVYRFLMKEAFVIAASYSKNDGDKVRGRAICNWLALDREVPEGTRLLARLNYHHWYVEPATSLLPSIDFHPIDVRAPDGYKPSNTSIVRHREGFVALIRAVNYDLLESGYFDRHGDSSFRQRILLARLNAHLEVTSVTEVHAPADLPPPLHTDSLGFQDPRPIVWRGALWCLSCIRQLNADGRAEMVLARIDQTDDARSILVDWRVLPSNAPVRWEKNWMPQIRENDLNLIYSLDPTRILTDAGDVCFEEAPTFAVENCGGGTQAIPFDGGWLLLVHEWQVLQTRRHYFHRFAWLDDRNRLKRLSRRFYFRQVASEFASGLAWHLTPDRLIVSFATDDRDPAIATVSAEDVRRILLTADQHESQSANAQLASPNSSALTQSIAPPEHDTDPRLLPHRAAGHRTSENHSHEPSSASYWLLSHHDTILYADPSTSQVRHGPIGAVPFNLTLHLQGDCGALFAEGLQCKSGHHLPQFPVARVKSVHGGVRISGVEITRLDENTSGLRIGNYYLSADGDGLIRNDRSWCREWEHFRLIRRDMLELIKIASRHSWVSQADRRILSLAAGPLASGAGSSASSTAPSATSKVPAEITFGQARVSIFGDKTSIFFEHPDSQVQRLPTALHVVGSQGSLQRYKRFNPLIYFMVYGHDTFYECLRESLSSLETYGRYKGTIAISCDRARDDILQFIPHSYHDRLITTAASPKKGYFNRYFLEQDIYESYQPIVCSDVDIVFDADITDLLIDVVLQEKVCCATEHASLRDLVDKSPRLWPEYLGNYFGRYLYAKEQDFPERGIALGNAGFIAFPNFFSVRQLYSLVIAITERQTPETITSFTDQPILNYALNKTALGDFSTLDRYGRLSRDIDDVPACERRGFVHFHLASGENDARAKLSIMRSYSHRLNQVKMPSEAIRVKPAIAGQLSSEEMRRLALLAKRVPPNGCIVEIGSLFGLSSWVLAQNAHPSVRVYCIDPWVHESWMAEVESVAGEELSLVAFRKNVADCPNIIPLRGYSPDDFFGWQRSVDLVFEDSVHTNPVLHRTLTFWSPLVRADGIVCGHDFSDHFPDVKAEVEQLAIDRASHLEVVDTLWSLSPPARPNLGEPISRNK